MLLDSKAPVQLLDVREPEEVALCALPAKHVPLAELPSRLKELDKNAETVVLCHHGIRSAHAAAFLLQAGFRCVRNLTGGIDRWAAEIDPQMRRY